MLRPLTVLLFALSVLAGTAHADEGSPPSERAALTGPAEPSPFGGYFELGARTLGTYRSAHPGLSGGFGARLGSLKLGIGFVFSPASFKDVRFELPLQEGQTYRGSSTLKLGAQEILAGVHASWVFDVPRLDWIDLEVPLLVGAYFLGTPLMGEDRKTPDGDRVSVWEDRLLAAQDLNLGLGIELGLRVRVRPIEDMPWLKLALGLHYIGVVGIDQTYLPADSIHGPSGSLALVIER